jgi:molybdopterin biosynthesis enzyme MoaB
MLGRGVSAIRGSSLIVNLPGSPRAVKENLSSVIDSLRHGLDILSGSATECSR